MSLISRGRSKKDVGIGGRGRSALGMVLRMDKGLATLEESGMNLKGLSWRCIGAACITYIRYTYIYRHIIIHISPLLEKRNK